MGAARSPYMLQLFAKESSSRARRDEVRAIKQRLYSAGQAHDYPGKNPDAIRQLAVGNRGRSPGKLSLVQSDRRYHNTAPKTPYSLKLKHDPNDRHGVQRDRRVLQQKKSMGASRRIQPTLPKDRSPVTLPKDTSRTVPTSGSSPAATGGRGGSVLNYVKSNPRKVGIGLAGTAATAYGLHKLHKRRQERARAEQQK